MGHHTCLLLMSCIYCIVHKPDVFFALWVHARTEKHNHENTIILHREKEEDDSFDPGDEPNLYAYWAASVIGPVVRILAVVHALLIPDFIQRITGSTKSCLHAIPGSIVGSIVSKTIPIATLHNKICILKQ